MSVSAEGAEKYFDESLKKSDYYARELGVWGGKGAERLELKGEVTREEFLALRQTRYPERKKSSRSGQRTSERRATISLFGSQVGFGLPGAER